MGSGEKKITCGKCGGYYIELYWDDKHTVVKDSAVAATCTTSGKTKGSHCSVCKMVFVEQKEIAPLGHNYGKKIIKKATPKKDGSVTVKCKVCGKKDETQSYKIYKPKKILLNDVQCVYNGKPIKSLQEVKNRKGASVEDYKVSYKKNKQVGIATVIVTFKGKYYKGKMTKKFTIFPKVITGKDTKDVSMHSANLNWEQVDQVTGYQIQYSENDNWKNAKTIDLKTEETTSTVVKGLLNNQEHDFQYRSIVLGELQENTNYSYRIRGYKTIKEKGKSKKIYSGWSSKENFMTRTMPVLNTRPTSSIWAGPYELYVLYLDERGYPYFYGKYGGSANMDAENYEKTELCQNEMIRYMNELDQALGIDFGTLIAGFDGGFGVHNGITVVKRTIVPSYKNLFE